MSEARDLTPEPAHTPAEPARAAPATARPAPATQDTPAPARPEPAPPGGRLEQAGLVLALLGDLASIPFHLVAFLLTRGAARARLARDIEDHRS